MKQGAQERERGASAGCGEMNLSLMSPMGRNAKRHRLGPLGRCEWDKGGTLLRGPDSTDLLREDRTSRLGSRIRCAPFEL